MKNKSPVNVLKNKPLQSPKARFGNIKWTRVPKENAEIAPTAEKDITAEEKRDSIRKALNGTKS